VLRRLTLPLNKSARAVHTRKAKHTATFYSAKDLADLNDGTTARRTTSSARRRLDSTNRTAGWTPKHVPHRPGNPQIHKTIGLLGSPELRYNRPR